MSKYHDLNQIGLKKLYIVTRPTDINQIQDDLEQEDSKWLAKSRRMRARRWRKIKHQLA